MYYCLFNSIFFKFSWLDTVNVTCAVGKPWKDWWYLVSSWLVSILSQFNLQCATYLLWRSEINMAEPKFDLTQAWNVKYKKDV